MSENAAHEERLTEYERAICYSTIPRVAHPLTYGIVAAYSLVLLGALALMVYGLRHEDSIWEQWGMIVFGVVVVLGIVGFLARAIANQIQERSALAEAESLPNVESSFDELPDPFEGHDLLRCSRHLAGDTWDITDNRGRTVYTVTNNHKGRRWDLGDATGDSVASISSASEDRSFDLSHGLPNRLNVTRDGAETATVVRQSGLWSGAVDIQSQNEGQDEFVYRAGGFYRGNELVGRIYFIRSFAYLDIRKTALNDGTLALFIATVR